MICSSACQKKGRVEEIQVSKTEDNSVEDHEKTSETAPVSKQWVHLSMQDSDRCLLAQTMPVAWYFKQESAVRCFFSGQEGSPVLACVEVAHVHFFRKKKPILFCEIRKSQWDKNEQSQTSHI